LRACSSSAPRPRATRPARRQGRSTTRKKELELPAGYHTWVFIGADLSLTYKPELEGNNPREQARHKDPRFGDFHNIYIDRTAYDCYLESGKFPDPTILVMEVFQAEKKDPKGFLTNGDLEGKRIGLEVAVKDKNRPGGGVPWAYYVFQEGGQPAPEKSAAAQKDSSCYQCHLAHASDDNVWVQFYPVLRDKELRDTNRP
jgi:hypothetical protein